MKRSLKSCLCLLFVFSNVYAHNKVVVIPLLDNGSANLAYTITVSKFNGDFTTIKEALDSIQDATKNRPYVIFVGPGRYKVESTIKMKRYVSLRGSGVDTTTLVGTLSNQTVISGCGLSKVVLQTENESSISDLSIENIGSSGNTMVGICNGGSNYISGVNIRVSNGTKNYGVFSLAEDSISLDHSFISASGKTGSANYGIYLDGTGANIEGGLIQSFGGTSVGVFAFDSTSARINNTRIQGGDYALRLEDGGSIEIADSFISGAAIFINTITDLSNTPSTLVIRTSTIKTNTDGNITGGGAATCLYSDDGFSQLLNNCSAPPP